MAAVSEPWPPAFMRTAPPTEPGTPTAHSRPRSPAAAVRRARTGRLTAAAGHHLVAVDGDGLEPRSEGDGQAGEAGVGHEEVGAATDHQDGDAGAGAPVGAGHGHQLLLVGRLGHEGGRPPTR